MEELEALGDEDVPTKPESPPRRAFPSIRTKLAGYFSLMSVAILVAIQLTDVAGLPFTSYRGRLGQQRDEAFRGLKLVADLKKNRLQHWVEEVRSCIRVNASNPFTAAAVARLRATVGRLRAAPASLAKARRAEAGGLSQQARRDRGLLDLLRQDEDYRSLAEHLESVQREYGIFDYLMILDAETGEVLVSTDESHLGGDYSDEDFFAGALSRTDTFVTDVRVDDMASEPSLHFSHAIRDETGRPAGVLCLGVSSDRIIRPLLHTGAGLGERGEALLISEDVRILTSLKHRLPDGTVAKPLEYKIHAEPAVRAARGEEGTIETRDYRGEPVLAAYCHVPVTPDWGWGMVIKRDREELFAPLRLSIAYTSAIGLGGIVTLVGLTIWLAGRLTRPIIALDETAIQVAAGRLDARAPVMTSDEVGHLARTFNTMLERIEERTGELAALNRELEAFSYSVSHDLRAPLRTIDGFSAVLLEDHAGALDAEGRRLLDVVRAQAQKMDQLITDLFEFSRLGRQEMTSSPIDVGALARAVCHEMLSTFPDRRVELRLGDVPHGCGDPVMIRQVLVNLLSNALKFTRARETAIIEVGSRPAGEGEIVYYVKDNGVGFDMTYAHKLFGVFQRLHEEDEFEGTGVGLAIVQRIVHRHGGRVWVEGRVGEGAAVYFTLPRKGNAEW